MKNEYHISEKAIKDLEHIWLHTLKKWSLKQADRYYNLLIDEIEFIAEDFESGKSVSHIREGYSVSKVKSHLIFYRKDKAGTTEIIRVLHQRMDIESRLNE